MINTRGVRFQILLMSPLPPITIVFSLVIQQERQFNSENNVYSKALAAGTATATGKGSSFGSSNGDKKPGKDKFSKGQSGNKGKVCSYCGKNGHMVDTCFKKYGFPPHLRRDWILLSIKYRQMNMRMRINQRRSCNNLLVSI